MSDDDAAVSFVFDFEVSADYLREQDIARRLAGWRTRQFRTQLPLQFLSLATAALTVFSTHTQSGCFRPWPGVWVLQCGQPMTPGDGLLWQALTPNALLWQNGLSFAVVGALLVLALTDPVRALVRPPRRRYQRLIKEHGLEGHERWEVVSDGLIYAGPDGITAHFPWRVFTAVRETPERFLLYGRPYEEVRVLPKRALADQSSVRQLGEFLRASVGWDSRSE
jgi:hypothetical protein